MKLLDEIEIVLRNDSGFGYHSIWITVHDNSLSKKWLSALNHLLTNQYHLEKNFCWLGWVSSRRNLFYLCQQLNHSVREINSSGIGYEITERFAPNTVVDDNGGINHAITNSIHRHFEILQGWAGSVSEYYQRATPSVRWHIRQLNLLCHELESFVLSLRKHRDAPDWRRPSQLMCWLNAPRFELDSKDFELFGIETINRDLGGVYVGVNKAVGKHHWEVFNDEGRDSRINELTTTALRGQTLAAGDFDIEWGRNPKEFAWQKKKLQEFAQWLTKNGFDAQDPALTIGHPQIGNVDLKRSFGTDNFNKIWKIVGDHLDVYKISTSTCSATYDYRWSDTDYAQQQIRKLT